MPISCAKEGNTPSAILRMNYATLVDAITSCLYRVTHELYAKELIPMETVNHIQTAKGISDLLKTGQLVSVIQRQLECSCDPRQYLIDTCHVLMNQRHKSLVDITTSIFLKLKVHVHVGQSETVVPFCSIPDDVRLYADIMRNQYKGQPIVATDWPPRVGKDFFGRVALIEKEDDLTEKESAWHLLRGKVDKIMKLSGNKEVDVNDILRPTTSLMSLRILIDGPPGIGKTTLCRKLLHMWSNEEFVYQQYDLVLYCPLRNAKMSAAATLADLFLYKSPKVSNVVEWISDKEGEGLLIIFDGWDELREQLRHSSLAASIIRREQLDRCSVIVTSRSYASSSLFNMHSLSRHVQVIGFLEGDISTVIIQTLQKDAKLAQELIDENSVVNNNTRHYKPDVSTTHSNKDSQQAIKLIQDLKIRGDVRSLCYVPLICSMVILVYRKEEGHLPTTLTQLYECFLLQTIRRHVNKREIDPYTLCSLSSLPSQLMKALQELSQVAYIGLAKTTMTFSLQDLQEHSLMSEATKEDYLGLMTTFLEYDEKKYQFLHLSIQEFLAAWWIAKHKKETEDVFKDHFDDDHFRMCLRFVAGLTHLEHERYQQFFDKKVSLVCNRDALFGFEFQNRSTFYKNPEINISVFDEYIPSDGFNISFILLLQFLFESRNASLCHRLTLSIDKQSLCHCRNKLSMFDWLCLGYFVSHSGATWNCLHLEDSYHQPSLHIFVNALSDMPLETQCKKFELKFHRPTTELLQKLFRSSLLYNMQECYCFLDSGHYVPSLLLLQFLHLPQLKILHVTMYLPKVPHNVREYTEKCNELEECIKMNVTLKEIKIDLRGNHSQRNCTMASIIRGASDNRSIKSLSLSLDLGSSASGDNFPFLPLPDGVIEQLLKNNNTIQALSLNIPDTLEPLSLDILEVNMPLTALEIGEFFIFQKCKLLSILRRINGLHCLILNRLNFSSRLIFHSHPSLQTLCLAVDTAKKAIELFTILRTNITLKALSVTVKEKTIEVGNSLCYMLTKNVTLQYFQINGSILCEFLPFLSDGIRHNTTLQHFSVGYIELSVNKQLKNLFAVISQKDNLKELQLQFKLSMSSNRLSQAAQEEKKTKMTALFFEHLLPDVTNMLQSHKTIKLLDINCSSLNNSFQPSWSQAAHCFYDSIFNHPSLEYIKVGFPAPSYLKEILEDQLIILNERHKKEQPLKTVPMINLN
ncbi:PREDICTED: uncharacterized protein LOC109582555 [Amphimedon queenslandica]|uniref:NACHT domain-containing protein n=2 Tax=Amphimedon queenslandica TaxID=400682 RepID=A0AAN0J828_AMPQE|nr:PREDICTED: uncharacterized protein LOC109582555 [Amphimedon queenslandica]|eukprot:XP_019852853.1 PREDICTED: uncharacterized protein LOC109582555 [Amphimedon queenslandica]